MGVEIPLVSKRDRLQDHQLFPEPHQTAEREAAQIPEGDPYKLIRGKGRHLPQQNLFKGVDNTGMRKRRGPLRERELPVQVVGEEPV